MRRLPKILRPSSHRTASERSTSLSDFPVSFNVYVGDTAVGSSVLIPRATLGALILEARVLDLHHIPRIGLHGLSRFSALESRALFRDFSSISRKSQLPELRRAALELVPLGNELSLSPETYLRVSAGG